MTTTFLIACFPLSVSYMEPSIHTQKQQHIWVPCHVMPRHATAWITSSHWIIVFAFSKQNNGCRLVLHTATLLYFADEKKKINKAINAAFYFIHFFYLLAQLPEQLLAVLLCLYFSYHCYCMKNKNRIVYGRKREKGWSNGVCERFLVLLLFVFASLRACTYVCMKNNVCVLGGFFRRMIHKNAIIYIHIHVRIEYNIERNKAIK